MTSFICRVIFRNIKEAQKKPDDDKEMTILQHMLSRDDLLYEDIVALMSDFLLGGADTVSPPETRVPSQASCFRGIFCLFLRDVCAGHLCSFESCVALRFLAAISRLRTRLRFYCITWP